MPQAAPKPCSHPACAVLVRDGTSRCPQHKAKAWAQAPGSETKRRTGRALQRDRAALFSREPLCRECSAAGRVALATIRDHVKPLAEGGADDDSNVQPLCQACSDAKTAAESARGVRRAFHGRRMDDVHSAPLCSTERESMAEKIGLSGTGGVQISGTSTPETDLPGKFLRAGVSGGGVPLGEGAD
jgi:5-methylcytosine-specific restriction protein A